MCVYIILVVHGLKCKIYLVLDLNKAAHIVTKWL